MRYDAQSALEKGPTVGAYGPTTRKTAILAVVWQFHRGFGRYTRLCGAVGLHTAPGGFAVRRGLKSRARCECKGGANPQKTASLAVFGRYTKGNVFFQKKSYSRGHRRIFHIEIDSLPFL